MKVFWSWQSDHPGKISRFLIRDAIEDAIQLLKLHADILEPDQRDRADKLELDHDRKNVPGSPKLADTIFEKITNAAVLVADVTPVASLRRIEEDGKKRTKKVMNPNVAIELGYGLHALSEERFIMIMNQHYGKRSDLPFDLSHYAGPILYRLEPDATADEIKACKSLLTYQIRDALKQQLVLATPVPVAELYVPASPKQSTGLFFEYYDTLGSYGDYAYERQDFSFQNGGSFSLRVYPKYRDELEFRRAELLIKLNETQLPAFGRNSGGFRLTNTHGAIIIEPTNSHSDSISACTQVFPSGEIWGVSEGLIIERNSRRHIAPLVVRAALLNTIPKYLSFAVDACGMSFPFYVEFSASRLMDCHLFYGGDDGYFIPLLDTHFSQKLEIQSADTERVKELVETFLKDVYDLAGKLPPKR